MRFWHRHGIFNSTWFIFTQYHEIHHINTVVWILFGIVYCDNVLPMSSGTRYAVWVDIGINAEYNQLWRKPKLLYHRNTGWLFQWHGQANIL